MDPFALRPRKLESDFLARAGGRIAEPLLLEWMLGYFKKLSQLG